MSGALPFSKQSGGVIAQALAQAQALVRSNQDAAAANVLNIVLRTHPDSERLLNFLGTIYFKLNKFREAEVVYKKLLSGNPQVPSLHANLGLIYIKSNRSAEAEAQLAKALSLNESNDKANLYMGVLLEKIGQPEKALSYYKKAKAIKSITRVKARLARPADPVLDVGADTVKLIIKSPAANKFNDVESSPDGDVQPAGSSTVEITRKPAQEYTPDLRVYDPRSDSGSSLKLPFGFSPEGRHRMVYQLDGIFYARERTLHSFTGKVQFVRSSFTKKMFRIEGRGRLVFSESGERGFSMLGDAFQEFRVRPDSLVGFTEGIRGQEENTASGNFVTLSGEGTVLLSTSQVPIVHSLKGEAPFYVQSETLVGWSSQSAPEDVNSEKIEGLMEGNGPLLAFLNMGVLLLD